MITSKKKDGTYGEVGFIKTRLDDGSYKDIEYLYDNDDNLIFEKGFTREIIGALPLQLDGIGKDLKDYNIKGNTYQSDGVSPDTPQEVKGCGDRTGNLWDKNDTYKCEKYTVFENNTEFYLPKGTYSLSYICNTTDSFFIRFLDNDENTLAECRVRSTDTQGKQNFTFTIEQDCIKIRVVENIGCEVSNIMLNSGSTPLPYEPYGKYKIPVVMRGKNLFDYQANKNSGIYLNDKGEEARSSIWITSDYIKVSGDYVTLSRIVGQAASICLYDRDKNFIYGESYASRTSLTVALNGAKFVRFSNTNTEYPKSQLELGTEATEYSPYTPPITTPIYLDKPLYKIGDYADSVGMTEEVRVIKELVLTGEENWRLVSTGHFVLSSITDYLRENDKLICYTTHYLTAKNTSDVAAVADRQAFFYFSSGNTWTDFYIKDRSFSTLDDFRAYLATQYANGTPVKVYYVLAEPEVTEVEPVEIPTLNGTTVIDVDTEVKPSNMWIEYKSSTSEYNPVALRTADSNTIQTADGENLMTRS